MVPAWELEANTYGLNFGKLVSQAQWRGRTEVGVDARGEMARSVAGRPLLWRGAAPVTWRGAPTRIMVFH